MKYKIKEIKSHYVSKGNLPIPTYVPMVKKNWYSPWLVIVSRECGITLKLSNKTYTKYGSCSRTYAHELIEKYKDELRFGKFYVQIDTYSDGTKKYIPRLKSKNKMYNDFNIVDNCENLISVSRYQLFENIKNSYSNIYDAKNAIKNYIQQEKNKVKLTTIVDTDYDYNI